MGQVVQELRHRVVALGRVGVHGLAQGAVHPGLYTGVVFRGRGVTQALCRARTVAVAVGQVPSEQFVGDHAEREDVAAVLCSPSMHSGAV